MSGLLYCKNARFISAYWRNLGQSTTELGVLLRNNLFIAARSFSSVEADRGCDKQRREEQRHSFTVYYLVNSCGLSLESAESSYRYVKFSTPEKPDSNIRLLKNRGFTDEQINKVVKSFPAVLLADAESTLLPKLKFLHDIGLSSADAAKLISSSPAILTRSLNKKLVPCHDFLKSVLGRDEIVLKCLKYSSWLFLVDTQKVIAPKFTMLRDLGVPQSHIKLLFTTLPRMLPISASRFNEIVKKAINMEFDPSKVYFIQAIMVIAKLHKSTWERKIKTYKTLGWSEDDVNSAFQKWPWFMAYSEKKITSTVDFLVENIGLPPSVIAKYPIVLGLSLERSIIPRYMVIGVLLSEGVLEKEKVNYLNMFKLGGKQFMDRFVIKHKKLAPQLLSIMERKTGIQDLGLCKNLVT